jgi:hypothetical protein
VDGVVAGNRHSTMEREIGDVGAADVRRETIDRWMLETDPTATPSNGGNDFVFVAGGHRDDDVLSAGTLNAIFHVRLRRDGARASENSKSRPRQDTHTAAENHGLYYSKGSAMRSRSG